MVTTGFGIPEMLHAGIRYNVNPHQFNFVAGTLNGQEQVTISAGWAYHVWGVAENSYQAPWYVFIGTTYMHYETFETITDDAYINLRIGRETYLFKNLSFTFELGAGFNYYHFHQRKVSDGWDFDFRFPVLPGGKIGVYYTFWKQEPG